MLRNLVPALGAIALCSTASAQEVAKGLFLDGWLDNTFQADTTDQDGVSSNTDFGIGAAVKVGWNINDKVSARVTLRSYSGDSFVLAEGVGTVKASDELTVSVGKSYGPIGYYAAEPTGLLTVTNSLTTSLYTIKPVGVWATYTPSDKVSITGMVADGFYNDAGPFGKPSYVDATGANVGKNDTNDVSFCLDVGFTPMAELALDLEGYVDPSGGAADTEGKFGSVYFVGFNAQWKKDAIVAGGEVLYRITQNAGATTDDDLKDLGLAGFVSYSLSTKMPMAVTGQLSYINSDTGENSADSNKLKAQLALLTNPMDSTNFGLNYEVFYTNEDPAGGGDKINGYGAAIEALFVIP